MNPDTMTVCELLPTRGDMIDTLDACTRDLSLAIAVARHDPFQSAFTLSLPEVASRLAFID